MQAGKENPAELFYLAAFPRSQKLASGPNPSKNTLAPGLRAAQVLHSLPATAQLYGGIASARLDGKYYPYGQERPSATTNGTEKFTGYMRDAETGLDYADQRFHSPGTGRFLTSDLWPSGAPNAVTLPDNWNRYGYVGGDPIDRTDPTGLCSPQDNPPCFSVTGTGVSGSNLGITVPGYPSTQNPYLAACGDGPVFDISSCYSTWTPDLTTPPSQSQLDPPNYKEILNGCIGSTLGITEVFAFVNAVASAPIISKPFTFPGSSQFTSPISIFLREVLQGARTSKPIYTITISGITQTTNLAGVIARFAPALTVATVVADLNSIRSCYEQQTLGTLGSGSNQ